jgi:hypothetical protein
MLFRGQDTRTSREDQIHPEDPVDQELQALPLENGQIIESVRQRTFVARYTLRLKARCTHQLGQLSNPHFYVAHPTETRSFRLLLLYYARFCKRPPTRPPAAPRVRTVMAPAVRVAPVINAWNTLSVNSWPWIPIN